MEKTKKQAVVILSDKYRFTKDALCMALEKYSGVSKKTGKAVWKTVGYYTSYEPMAKKILYLESLEIAAEKAEVSLKEYMDILRNEIAKVTKMFEGIDNVFRTCG